MKMMFERRFISIFTVVVVLNIEWVGGALPGVIKPCSKEGNGFKTCLTEILENIRGNLASGSFGPGYDTPKMEPMFMKLMEISGNELNINMTDLYSYGSTTYKVIDIKPDFQKLQFDIELLTPQMTYKSQYSLSQKFPMLNVDVRGSGDISGVFNKIHSKLRVKFQVVENNIKLERIRYKMRIENGSFKINSLSNVNDGQQPSKIFTEIANNFINSEPSFILRKIEPSLEKNFIEIVTAIIDSLFKNVTVNDVFLE